MQSSVETLQGLERRLTMAVPVMEIDQQVDARLKNLARTVRMPGFRQGKVPMKLVAQQYGPQVRGEVIGDAVQKAFTDAVQAQKLRIAGYPKIEPKADAGQSDKLEFSATFEVYPEFALGDISTTALERPVLELGEAEIDRTIESLRKQRAKFEDAGRAAASGDRATVDFVGKIDGVEFQGGSATGFTFSIGERRMLPEFEVAVTGMSAGEVKVFPLTFPPDYQGKDVAGRTAEFTVTVQKVEQPVLPAIDAEFAKTLGVPDGDIEKMRSEIKENVQREVKQRLSNMLKQRVMQALLDTNKPAVPNALIEMEQERLVQSARVDLQQRGMKDVDKLPIDPGMFKDQALRRVNLGLILSEVVKQHGLAAKPEQVRKLVEEHARTFEQPFEVVKWVYSQPERLAEFEGLAVEANVVEWAVAKAKVQEKPVVFEELMGSSA
jgi:trigger factor